MASRMSSIHIIITVSVVIFLLLSWHVMFRCCSRHEIRICRLLIASRLPSPHQILPSDMFIVIIHVFIEVYQLLEYVAVRSCLLIVPNDIVWFSSL